MNASYPSQLTTKPFDFTNVCGVSVNLNTAAASDAPLTGALPSSVKVELLSATGYRIDGFGKANATAIGPGVDDIDVAAAWTSGHLPISSPMNMGVMLRVHCTGTARVYALTLHAC